MDAAGGRLTHDGLGAVRRHFRDLTGIVIYFPVAILILQGTLL
jgi:hypothetical protein